MKIMHRVSLTTTPKIRRALESAGIVAGEGFVSFELNEADERWAKLAPRLAEWQAVDVPVTKFSAREMKAAEWLQMTPDWHCGYPQPDEDNFGYLDVTYDTTERCAACGAGAKQKGPFLMKGEPKWGTRSILQLNWVFDEFFTTPEVWSAVFKPLGLAFHPVLDGKGKQKLETVVQLVVTEAVDVDVDDLPGKTCGICKRTKRAPVARGMFPTLQQKPSGHVVRTKQIFGSGASAFLPVIVSQVLFKRLQEQKAKGVSFVPVL